MVINMNNESKVSKDALATMMVSVLQEKWRQEIEHAVNKVKLGISGQRTRTQMDRWLRHLWYRDEALSKRRPGGPRIIRE
jgi:hypothetical protein